MEFREISIDLTSVSLRWPTLITAKAPLLFAYRSNLRATILPGAPASDGGGAKAESVASRRQLKSQVKTGLTWTGLESACWDDLQPMGHNNVGNSFLPLEARCYGFVAVNSHLDWKSFANFANGAKPGRSC